jgi:hypothetical protein
VVSIRLIAPRALVAVLLLLCFSIAGAGMAVARAGTRGHCRTHAKVILRTPSVVVWRSLQTRRGRTVYRYSGCLRTSGRVVKLASMPPRRRHAEPGTYFALKSLTAAGPYVAFVHVEETTSELEVFDLARGRRELATEASCEGHSECPAVPELMRYVLAPNGWIVELYAEGSSGAETLLATNGEAEVPIDFGLRFGRISLTDRTLRWTSEGLPRQAPIGPELIPVEPPSKTISGCGLLSVSSVNAVVGPGAAVAEGTAPVTKCTFTTSPQVRLVETTGLSQQQVASLEHKLAVNAEFEEGGPADGFAGSNNEHDAHYHPSEYGPFKANGVPGEFASAFFADTELTLEVLRTGENDDVRVQRMLLEAVTALYRVPIDRP